MAQSKGLPDPYANAEGATGEGETTGFSSETVATLDGGTDVDDPPGKSLTVDGEPEKSGGKSRTGVRDPDKSPGKSLTVVRDSDKSVQLLDSAASIPSALSHPSMIVVPHEPLPRSTIATAEVDDVQGVKRAIIIID